ncbi:hypothetical protein L207DRAFT_534813 [Hyaloscypha variabilis F]|jgi:hypothetical protein|uniref:Uncharacterized protein n=1 Tax=Hyaloscypha variabilis (strain UAMH 11265 / GT02V1 / F) TaxID=1149755 RepID=A0A2J6R7L0_HYAVF|nr:hypothetical protein L207DRAFT_534813 [Hyaloscypha variabilis F]
MSSPVKPYPTGLVRRPSQGSQGLIRRRTSRSGQVPLLRPATPTTPLPLVRRRSQSIARRPETPAQGEHPFLTACSPRKSSMKRSTPTPTIPQTPVSDSSTASSTLKAEKRAVISGQAGEPKISRRRKLKEELFFAFVLLPLSCWYTRGGKRLVIDDEDGSEMRVRRVPIGEREDITVRIGGRAIS